MNAIQARIRRLDDQIRQAEQTIASVEAEASGMSPRQFAMARERIEMHLARARSSSPQRGFTATELRALGAKQPQLLSAM
jgi:hypothetical protein